MGLEDILKGVREETDDLYLVEFEGIEVPFRLLPYKKAIQYKALLTMSTLSGEISVIYELIFKQCCEDKYLANHNYDIPAGIPETVAQLILHLSGLETNSIELTQSLFESYRSEINVPSKLMMRRICEVFSGYNFEILYKLSYPKIVEIFIQAEKVLIERGIIESEYSFSSPEEKKDEAQKALYKDMREDRISFAGLGQEQVARQDPRAEAIRQQALARAEAEERQYHQKIRG